MATQRAAFTLIEVLAVVAIFALLMSLLAPRVSSVGGRDLTQAAERIRMRIDLARQRAALTGIPHRLLIDLDSQGYRVEWRVSEARQEGVEPEPVEPIDLRGRAPIPMTPSRAEELEFRPLPGISGRFEWLKESLVIAGVETAEGFADRGDVAIEFELDGSSAYTSLHLMDESGRKLMLDVLPLADLVRIYVEES